MEATLGYAPTPRIKIRPSSNWDMFHLPELMEFSGLLIGLAVRDVKLRYRQTALGVTWVVFQPLMAAGIFTIVFGQLAKMDSDGLPYFIFSYVGQLGWSIFANTMGRSSSCLVGNAHLVSKVYFPRLILPISTVMATMVDFVVSLAVLAILMPMYHISIGWPILLMPFWVLMFLMLSLGFGLVTAALMVSYRDVAYIVPVLTQMLMYGSPVMYSVRQVLQKLPVRFQPFFFCNPMTGLLEGFRWSLLNRGDMHWSYFVYPPICSVVAFLIGALAFQKMERRFADVI